MKTGAPAQACECVTGQMTKETLPWTRRRAGMASGPLRVPRPLASNSVAARPTLPTYYGCWPRNTLPRPYAEPCRLRRVVLACPTSIRHRRLAGQLPLQKSVSIISVSICLFPSSWRRHNPAVMSFFVCIMCFGLGVSAWDGWTRLRRHFCVTTISPRLAGRGVA
jgi:hypothetical protein